MKWEELRMEVKNCEFAGCPRNRKKLPILFDRSEDSLARIRFVVVSQEPGAGLRKRFSSPERMEEFLASECDGNQSPKGGGLPHRMREIFGRKFNPRSGEIYWTHALKCVPTRNDDIKRQWRNCAASCVDHFKKELTLIPSKRLTVIPIERYALALCRHVFENNRLTEVGGIMKYIKNLDPEERFEFDGKKVRLLPFVHPSNRGRVLKRYDENNEVENKEKKLVKIIQKH
ncbi:MAG: hypothetical protein ACTSP1_18105 [Candidatus Freyarchaeota archaeon]